jgi:quercetin dioxygenase-like cupin family protein
MPNNVMTVAGIYEAFDRGDADWILQQLDTDVEWDQGNRDTGLPYLRPRRGKVEVEPFFAELANSLELTHFEPIAICDGGDFVTVPVDHAGRIVNGGEVPMLREVHVWKFGVDGKVVSFRHIYDYAVHEQAAAKASKQFEGKTLQAVGETLKVLQAGENFEVFEMTGTADSGPPLHSHPWMESYYGIAGETEVTVGETSRILHAGDFVEVPAGELHTFKTLGSNARALIMTSGHRASAFFADIAANVPPGAPTPDTLPTLIEVAKRNGLSSPLFA